MKVENKIDLAQGLATVSGRYVLEFGIFSILFAVSCWCRSVEANIVFSSQHEGNVIIVVRR